MESGWLLGDGDVIASTVTWTGWRHAIVTSSQLASEVGAVVCHGPVVSFGVCVAEVSPDGSLSQVTTRSLLHARVRGRHILLKPDVADVARRANDVRWQVVR